MSRVNLRSRAYPVKTLGVCLEFLGLIVEKLGFGEHFKEKIAEALGHQHAKGGMAARKIGALSQFGLIEWTCKEHYQVTELGKTLSAPADEMEKIRLLRQAVRQPPLYAALFDEYEPQGRLPEFLHNVLARNYGINPSVAKNAAATFQESAVFVGLLDTSGQFMKPSVPEATGEERRGSSTPGHTIPLHRRRTAELQLPSDYTKNDLELIRDYLDFMLERTIEQSDEEKEP